MSGDFIEQNCHITHSKKLVVLGHYTAFFNNQMSERIISHFHLWPAPQIHFIHYAFSREHMSLKN